MPDARRNGLCAHCGKKRWLEARNLCGTCYRKPEIREATPCLDGRIGGDYGRRSDTPIENIKPASKPTKCLPGTERKVEVLIERAAAGEELWHPLDAKRKTN